MSQTKGQLNIKLLKKFLKSAGDTLAGEWVLIGGTVLPLLDMHYRVTTDIDCIPLTTRDHNSSLLSLMDLTEKLGLPVEMINSAGLYFLEKIPDYKTRLAVLYKGKSAVIYRPDVNLFLMLKMSRLTESDLADCLEFIKFARKEEEKIDLALLRKAIEKRKKGSTEDRVVRLQILSDRLFEK